MPSSALVSARITSGTYLTGVTIIRVQVIREGTSRGTATGAPPAGASWAVFHVYGGLVSMSPQTRPSAE